MISISNYRKCNFDAFIVRFCSFNYCFNSLFTSINMMFHRGSCINQKTNLNFIVYFTSMYIFAVKCMIRTFFSVCMPSLLGAKTRLFTMLLVYTKIIAKRKLLFLLLSWHLKIKLFPISFT